MAGKKITELTQANAVADTDLFIVETANGTQSVPYSSIKSEGVSFNGTGANSIALRGNAPTDYSIAIGENANVNCNGKSSIAIGKNANVFYGSAIGTKEGNDCIAIGNNSSCKSNYSISIGSNSSAMGSSISIGYNCHVYSNKSIAIGYQSEVDGENSQAYGVYVHVSGNNSVAIGYQASTSNNNNIQFGNDLLSSITAKVPITTTSDERDKTDITEIDNSALEFLNKVKAIRYVFNGRKLYIDNDNLSDEEREKLNTYGMCDYDKKAHAQGTKKGSRIRVGVSAQNIQQALIDVFGDSGYANLVNDNLFDYNPDDIPDGVESQLAVNYEGFIPFLIKAVQELDARVKELENK